MKKLFLFLCFITFYTSLTAQFLPREDFLFPGVYPRPHVLDIDSDGDLDLIMAVLFEEKLVWYSGSIPGVYEDELIIDADYPDLYYAELADLNGDGLVDIVVGTREYGLSENRLSWYENLGGGTFSTENEIMADVTPQLDLELADMDNDGDIDIITLDNSDPGWYENDGTGTFEDIVVLNGYAASNPGMIEIADFDNDGDNDIFVGGSTYPHWIENLGGGVFADGALLLDWLMDSSFYYDIELEDLNGDDYPDLIVYRLSSPTVIWYPNLGDGTLDDFIEIGSGSAYAPSEADMEVGDWNYDGLNDIFWSSQSHAAGASAIESTGLGTFTDPIELPDIIFEDEFVGSLELQIIDLNYDGKMDVVGDIAGDRMSVFWGTVPGPHAVKGHVFIDINENGIQDLSEETAELYPIYKTPYDATSFTDSTGEYSFGFGPGLFDSTFTITPHDSPLWGISTDFDSYDVLLDTSAILDTFHFGLYPIAAIDSIETYLTGGFPRCNDTLDYNIMIYNLGSTIPSGIIELELDDSVAYISAEILPDSIVDQHIYWAYTDLYYFGVESFNVQVQMPDGISDTVTSTLTATVVDLDEILFTASNALTEQVVCAYDPNDKRANPQGYEEEGFIDVATEQIEYTVRFQNTGTDTAFTVVIRDQLDPNLDWSSFALLAHSHDVEIEISPDGRAAFSFNDIMLPDSNINEPASHGFIKYAINLNEDLPLGTEINNRADIYFDLNLPILTNTTRNTLYDCNDFLTELGLSSTAVCAEDTIFGEVLEVPEFATIIWEIDGETIEDDSIIWHTPGTYDLTISISTDHCSTDSTISITIFDPIPVTELETVNICFGESALIFDTYETESGIYIDSLASIFTGCDSIVQLELIVNELPITTLDPAPICVGDSLFIFDAYQTESGLYTDSLTSVMGCDSVVILELVVNEFVITPLETMGICMGDSVLIFDNYETSSGVYYDTLSTEILGCDSILTQELIVNDLPIIAFETVSETVICLDDEPFNLNASPSGGEFSGPGVSGTTFNPNSAGEGGHWLFYTFVDDNSCTATDSVSVTVSDCLGLADNDVNEFTIYPNPFTEFTTIYFGTRFNDLHMVTIYNTLGEIVYRKENVQEKTLIIEQETLGKGVFLVEIYNTSTLLISTQRLVIQ